MVNAQKLKDKIEEKYGSLDDESGCYIGNQLNLITYITYRNIKE